jgi:hypothetical protein
MIDDSVDIRANQNGVVLIYLYASDLHFIQYVLVDVVREVGNVDEDFHGIAPATSLQFRYNEECSIEVVETLYSRYGYLEWGQHKRISKLNK